MILKLAWRNIWRNKRRSLITMASIMLAVIFAVVLRSMQLGTYEKVIGNVVESYTGYIQIHQKGYWDEPFVDNSMWEDSLDFDALAASDKNILAIHPRLECFALSSYKERSQVIKLMGIDPESEDRMMDIKSKITKGNFIDKNSNGVMLGYQLADYLGVVPNDTLILLGQGYHGQSAAGKYPVSAILEFGSPILNKGVIMMALKNTQNFQSTPGMISSGIVLLDKSGKMDDTEKNLKAQIDENQYEIMNWEAMVPELKQTIQADSAGGMIMLFILYMVISFGIFGTVLMMNSERRYEFGVLLSVGMSRFRLIRMMVGEIVLMGLTGAAMGAVIVYPISWYFHLSPIQLGGKAAEALEKYGFEAVLISSTDPMIAISHAGIILVITICISLYPIFSILKMKEVEAMRS